MIPVRTARGTDGADSCSHWVSEFAPARYQRILSYVAGMFPLPLAVAIG